MGSKRDFDSHLQCSRKCTQMIIVIMIRHWGEVDIGSWDTVRKEK